MTNDSAINYAIALLSHYGFELRGYTAQELVNLWLEQYEANWLRLGVIEALYQGRYKAVSVEQILAVWSRRGKPTYRFTHEFERLISRKLPKSLTTAYDVNLTEFNEELSLPPLTSFQEISTEEELPEFNSPKSAPPIQRETSPQAKNKSSIITHTPFESIDQLPEVATDQNTNKSFPRQKSGVGVLVLEDNTSVQPKENNSYASIPKITTVTLTSSDDGDKDSNFPNPVDWSNCEFSKLPIEQFTPPPDYSGFCLKLKAVVGELADGETGERKKGWGAEELKSGGVEELGS